MNLLQESYQRLFPDKPFEYQTIIEYNRRLSDFNANIRLTKDTIQLNLNLQWKDIDDEIKIGLTQSLLLKILKQKKNTPNLELYHHFIKNIPLLTPKTKTDPSLEPSFQRINQTFFQNQLEQPNLIWGQPSFRKLASYNFHNDTITVSTIFQDAKPEILDFLMYHEMLHKHHKFQVKNNRSSFHSAAFKKAEEQYPQHKEVEQQINQIIRIKKRNSKTSSKLSLFHFFR